MSDIIAKICFDKSDFNLYLFLLVIFVIYLMYIIHTNNMIYIKNISKIKETQTKETQIKDINTQPIRVKNIQSEYNQDIKNRFLDKIVNPLSGTSPMNPQGSFSNPRGFDGYRHFQQLGYISGSNGIYPVMGRYKFSNNTDKYDLYTIDNERGRIKIPFKTKNDYLYDGDSINIPELGGEFIFKKYEDIDGNRYDPNIIY